MPLNTDRPINRAMVVGCAISATRNYLKLHMPRTLNPLLRNIRAETQKLWQRSAMRVANSLPGAVHQSTHRPLMHPACPPRCPLSWAPLHADMHVVWCCARAYHRERRRHAIPIALAAPSALHCPRLRALALFGRRPLQRVVSLVIPATKNLHKCSREQLQ